MSADEHYFAEIFFFCVHPAFHSLIEMYSFYCMYYLFDADSERHIVANYRKLLTNGNAGGGCAINSSRRIATFARAHSLEAE